MSDGAVQCAGCGMWHWPKAGAPPEQICALCDFEWKADGSLERSMAELRERLRERESGR